MGRGKRVRSRRPGGSDEAGNQRKASPGRRGRAEGGRDQRARGANSFSRQVVAAEGIVTMKALPCPRTLSPGSRRRAAQTSSDQRQSDPGALVSATRAFLTRWKRSKMRGNSSAGNAALPVSHDQFHDLAHRARPTAITPARANFESVRQQVQDDLSTDRGPRRPAPAAAGSPQSIATRLARRRVEVAGQPAVSAARSVGSWTACTRAGLDAGEIQQAVDQLEQAQAVAVRQLQSFPPRELAARRRRRVIFQRRQQQGQWGAEPWLTLLKKGGLGAVDLGQRLGALAFRFMGDGVGDDGRDGGGQQFENVRYASFRAGGDWCPPPAPDGRRVAGGA